MRLNVWSVSCIETYRVKQIEAKERGTIINKQHFLLDLFELFDLEIKGQGPTKVITVCDTPPHGHAPTYQILTYLERQKCYGPDKKRLFKKNIIWPWGQRSMSHEGHYGMQHTTLWSCTHIPNIIDLSGKKKKLWSGQASLRRSGSGSGRKKNQTKAICLPSFEGET